MEIVLAAAIGILTASGVWLVLRPRTFQVIIGLSLIMVGVNLRGVRFVANFNSLIVLLQVLIIGFFTVLIYQKLSAGQNALGDIAQHGHDEPGQQDEHDQCCGHQDSL